MLKKKKILVYAIILTLVFEGILRKLLPPLAFPIFVLKDVICILSIIAVRDGQSSMTSVGLLKRYYVLVIFFLPVFLRTLFLDPFLAIFGTKQYLLYISLAFLIPKAFPKTEYQSLRKLFKVLPVLLIPTTLIAVLQNALPSGHWLNATVDGQSLEEFTVEGYQRVSSTFSFTAQYSWFLNAICASLFAYMFTFPTRKRITQKGLIVVYIVMLLIGAFITGGRTAVLGCGATILIGAFFSLVRSFSYFLKQASGIIVSAGIAMMILRIAKPEYFAAYEIRSAGSGKVSHSEEIGSRIISQFTHWNVWFWNQDAESILLGNGIGVMTNGSELVSSYSKKIRQSGFWTEDDLSNTLWEGGLYLLLIWGLFRISVIAYCFRTWYAIKSPQLSLASSFYLSFIIVTGLTGALGIQAPLALWFWISVGFLMTLRNINDGEHC